MAPTMLEELCKRIQHGCATLRRSRNQRNVGSCWLKSLTGFKLCPTTSNNMQQGLQTDATCNIRQCWELLANNVASVCTGLKLWISFVITDMNGDQSVRTDMLGMCNYLGMFGMCNYVHYVHKIGKTFRLGLRRFSQPQSLLPSCILILI